MARDYYIHGETMVSVKSNPTSTIGVLTNLGLSDNEIVWSLNYRHLDIAVDTHGGDMGPPPEIQCLLADCSITITFVHFERSVLEECLRLSMGGGPTLGTLPHAGARMGNNVARFAVGNNFIGLNLHSPVAARPIRFHYAYMTSPPVEWPLGTRRSLVRTNWRAVPYTIDPWNAGQGSFGQVLWDYELDS